MERKRKIKLKFALIQKNLTFSDILKKEIEIKQKANYEYIYKERKLKINNNFINKIIDDKKVLLSSKQFVVVCFKIKINNEERKLIITNGDIRSFVNVWKLEPNFGIKTWINYHLGKDMELEFRNINFKNRINGNHFSENKTISQSIGSFQYNQITDFLKTLTIKVNFNKTNMLIKLDNYFEMPFDENKNINVIYKEIAEIIEKYSGRDNYKQNYGFIDHFKNVSKKLETKILNHIWAKIEGDSSSLPYFISWPSFTDNENHAFFTIGKNNDQLFDLDFKTVIKKAKQERAQLKNVYIYSKNHNDGELDSNKLEKCLFAEWNHKDKQYVINEGRVFNVDLDFMKQINDAYNKFPLSSLKFKNWNNEMTEKEYNSNLTSCKDSWINLDRQNIFFGNHNRLEIADVLIVSKDKTFVAIKKMHNSAVISHLVAQVKNSINAIFGAPKKVEEFIREKTNDKTIKLNNFSKFVIAIATKDHHNNERPRLPFFAKLSIINLETQKVNRMKIEIAWIKLV